jgi:hypothetical protein
MTDLSDARRSTFSPEPRWPALVAALAAGGLYVAMPERLAAGPSWLLLSVVAMMVILAVITHQRGNHRLNQVVGFSVEALLTLAMVWSLAMLIHALFAHSETPALLLRSAALIWGTNVLVFALWYWRLDGGGPHGRDREPGHRVGAFLFPQMTQEGAAAAGVDESQWSPRFVDYLFLAFNTSTALSPTDAPILSRWAKVLVMLQALISLTTVAILVGRVVNIL